MARPQLLPKLFNANPFCEKMKYQCRAIKQEKKNNTSWINQIDNNFSCPKHSKFQSQPLLYWDDRLNGKLRQRTALSINSDQVTHGSVIHSADVKLRQELFKNMMCHYNELMQLKVSYSNQLFY